MSGRLRTSFRRGNLAEHLGMLLLKGVAAVAEVARPEDVGVDAVATLLRPADDGNCYAEDTFLVQLKSASVKNIDVLRWKLSDVGNTKWATETYSTLKKFLALTRRELELLSLGQCSALDWDTNDPASIKSHSGVMKGHPDDLAAVAARCSPCLLSLMFQALSMRGETGSVVMGSLVQLAAALRQAGVEIDADQLFSSLFCALNDQRKNEESKP